MSNMQVTWQVEMACQPFNTDGRTDGLTKNVLTFSNRPPVSDARRGAEADD